MSNIPNLWPVLALVEVIFIVPDVNETTPPELLVIPATAVELFAVTANVASESSNVPLLVIAVRFVVCIFPVPVTISFPPDATVILFVVFVIVFPFVFKVIVFPLATVNVLLSVFEAKTSIVPLVPVIEAYAASKVL